MIFDCQHHFSTEGQLRSRGVKSAKIGRTWEKEGKIRTQEAREAGRIFYIEAVGLACDALHPGENFTSSRENTEESKRWKM